MLLPVICFCFARWAPGEYSARCAHGRASPIRDRRLAATDPKRRESRFRSLIYRLDPIRGSVSVSKDQGRMFRSRTNDKSIVTTDNAINRSSSIHSIPVGLLDTENIPRPRRPTGSSWYAPLSIGRTNRRTVSDDLRYSRLSQSRTMSIPSRRPVCYCKETTGIGRLLQCCCSCNVREQTACTVISGMLFRVSPSMRMRPGGISCGVKAVIRA